MAVCFGEAEAAAPPFGVAASPAPVGVTPNAPAAAALPDLAGGPGEALAPVAPESAPQAGVLVTGAELLRARLPPRLRLGLWPLRAMSPPGRLSVAKGAAVAAAVVAACPVAPAARAAVPGGEIPE